MGGADSRQSVDRQSNLANGNWEEEDTEEKLYFSQAQNAGEIRKLSRKIIAQKLLWKEMVVKS